MSLLITYSAELCLAFGIIASFAGFELRSLFGGSKEINNSNMNLYRAGILLMVFGPALALYGFATL